MLPWRSRRISGSSPKVVPIHHRASGGRPVVELKRLTRNEVGQVVEETQAPTLVSADASSQWTTVATAAAIHTDAHFAKDVVACQDAAARDPGQEPLYLTAARRLENSGRPADALG